VDQAVAEHPVKQEVSVNDGRYEIRAATCLTFTGCLITDTYADVCGTPQCVRWQNPCSILRVTSQPLAVLGLALARHEKRPAARQKLAHSNTSPSLTVGPLT
jgi:hypothetical protein